MELAMLNKLAFANSLAVLGGGNVAGVIRGGVDAVHPVRQRMPPRRTESAASHPSSPSQSSSPPRRIHPEKIARRAAVSPGLDKPAFV
jgi:hypothetical protein